MSRRSKKMNANPSKPLNIAFAKHMRTHKGFMIAERGDLHLAAEHGELDNVQKLLNRGGDCSANDELGFSPLHQAIMGGHVTVVDALLQAGANVNGCGIDQCSPLYLAAGMNLLVVVKRLLAIRGIDVHTRTAADGFTALHQASMLGFADIVEALLSGGANVRAETNDKETPLHLTILYRHFGVFKILMAAGADVTDVTKRGVGCLHLAAASGFTIQGVKVLLSHSLNADACDYALATPLHYAATYGHLPITRLLVKRGVDVNLQDLEGTTALHRTAGPHMSWAIRSLYFGELTDRMEVARFLLARGADVHKLDNLKRTALHIAVFEGQPSLAACLIEGGARVNDGSSLGTPLHVAVELCIDRHPEGRTLVEGLLLSGADPNCKDEFGLSTLHLAVIQCEMWVIKLLLASGAHYDIEDLSVLWCRQYNEYNEPSSIASLLSLIDTFYKAIVKNNITVAKKCLDTDRTVATCHSAHYMTPLHYPAWKGFVDLTVLLLNYGANPNAANSKFAPPLHYAAKYGHLLVALALLKSGAIYDAVYTKTNRTPLMIAKSVRCDKLASLLETIDRLFRNTRDGNVGVVKELKALKQGDRPRFLAITNTRNSQNQKLIDVAMAGKFESIVAFLN